jgi:hypothetical protein
MDKMYLQGRVVATSTDEAIEAIYEKLERQGYEVERVAAYPCLVQPYPWGVWVEYMARVKSIMEVKS